jgi:protocatechuate 3,4-dioxygenase beta subunit
MDQKLSRRQLGALAAPLALAIAAGRGAGISLAQDSESPILAPTPACGDADDFAETLAQTEGPYFTPDSPERTDFIEPGMPGTKLVVTGYVYSTDCTPIPNALLDFWQCDDAGVYDNEGYTLRGHQFTDEAGRYELTTIVPGIYTGRTRQIHVKVQEPDRPVLTSQLYFPDEPANASDGIFDPSLVMDLADADNDDGKVGFFTFVLE